jgi:pterin-4a-carbinolamine dehydratase
MSPWPAPERRDWRPTSGILRPGELRPALRAHPAWTANGRRLTRALRTKDYAEALAWLDAIAAEVDHFGRRPDLAIVATNRVLVGVENPNHAGVTTAELALVEQVDRLVARRRAQPAASADTPASSRGPAPPAVSRAA